MSNHNFLARPFSWSIALGIVFCVISGIIFLFARNENSLMIFSPLFSSVLLTSGILLILLGFGAKHELDQINSQLIEKNQQLSEEVRKSVFETSSQFYQKLELSELAKECEKIGLTKIQDDSSHFRFDEIIINPNRLVVVLNDGRTWSSQHRDRLRKRFEDPSKETTIFLSHPDSTMIQVLARKGSNEVAILQNRIRETVVILEELKKSSTSLEILGHHLFNPFSLILGDDEAVMTPYFLSRGGRTRPLFQFQRKNDGGYFSYLEADIERLRIDAEDISSSKKKFDSNTVIQFQIK